MIIGNVMRGLCELEFGEQLDYIFSFFFAWSSGVPVCVELAKHW